MSENTKAISWSDCHIDWEGADICARVTHIPSGIYIEPNEKLAPDASRDHLLELLAAKVGAPQ